ncbi:hypothetical protein [uncultured Microbulbifer sp.]|uniref:hypothetical protein n=1 Tax=uncultured Microbulbifer sp. TaxID=348147 RepID=UPI0025CD9CEA|nr:hypothetical protein [uncultured Microbulbifer sp.]
MNWFSLLFACSALYLAALNYFKPVPENLGAKGWEWAEMRCAKRGGIKGFKIVKMRYVTVVCGDGDGAMAEWGVEK